jgi:rubrerythrin
MPILEFIATTIVGEAVRAIIKWVCPHCGHESGEVSVPKGCPCDIKCSKCGKKEEITA